MFCAFCEPFWQKIKKNIEWSNHLGLDGGDGDGEDDGGMVMCFGKKYKPPQKKKSPIKKKTLTLSIIKIPKEEKYPEKDALEIIKDLGLNSNHKSSTEPKDMSNKLFNKQTEEQYIQDIFKTP